MSTRNILLGNSSRCPSTIKLLKTKIKSCGDETIDLNNKEIYKVGSNYICLVVILIDFVLKKDENYYKQVFL